MGPGARKRELSTRSDRAAGPGRSQTRTACARNDAVIRHAGTADRIFSTRPAFETNTMSIGNFMKNVWIALVGAITMAVEGGSDVCARSPLRLVSESNAVIS